MRRDECEARPQVVDEWWWNGRDDDRCLSVDWRRRVLHDVADATVLSYWWPVGFGGVACELLATTGQPKRASQAVGATMLCRMSG